MRSIYLEVDASDIRIISTISQKYMNTKTIIRLEHPRHMHMVGDGFRVANYLP